MEINSDPKVAVEVPDASVVRLRTKPFSEKRAEAVRSYLVAQGVPADRVTATGRRRG